MWVCVCVWVYDEWMCAGMCVCVCVGVYVWVRLHVRVCMGVSLRVSPMCIGDLTSFYVCVVVVVRDCEGYWICECACVCVCVGLWQDQGCV